MERLELKTTLNAYPKLSPSILSNYVTKDDLSQQLDNYVEEAPVDSKLYARENESWVEILPETKALPIKLHYGANSDLQIDNISDVEALSEFTMLSADTASYILNYTLSANGYLWICSSRPVKSIIWGAMGLIADYEYQTAVISSNNNQEVYYCYRITDMLTAGQFVFLVNF